MLPTKLYINNFYSHEESYIDFDQFDSTLLVGNTEGDYDKSNGSGKSAIFESILWCLFNKTRASMMDDIVSWGESRCVVSLEFVHKKESFKIKRTRDRLSSTSTVELYDLDEDGNWRDISAATAGTTNKKIESIIKSDYKTFINSVYFRQNDISEFAESEPGKRKDILKSIVDISRWDDYEKLAREKLKGLKAKYSSIIDNTEDYSEVLQQKEGVESGIEDLKIRIDSDTTKLSSVDKSIAKYRREYLSIKESLDTDSYDRTLDDIKKLKLAGRELKSKAESLSESEKKYSDILSEKEDEVLSAKNLISSLGNCDFDKDLLKEYTNSLSKNQSSLTSFKELLDSSQSIDILSGECYVCNQDIDDNLHEHLVDTHNKKIDSYYKKIDEANLAISKLEELISSQEEKKANKDLADSTLSKIRKLELEASIARDQVGKLKDERVSLVDKMTSIKYELNSLGGLLRSLEDQSFKDIMKKIDDLTLNKKELLSLISSNNKELGILTQKLESVDLKIKDIKDKKEEAMSLKSEISNLERLSKLLGKNGIQTILLDAIIEDLEKSSNAILASICNEPSTIMLETQRVGSDGISIVETLDLRVRRDGITQNFKSLSGGEQFRISLALRIALSEVSSLHGGSSLEFLLLDEVNSPLDRYGTETLFVSVIKSLESKYKIMVITHDDSLKEKFENVIDVTKINGKSELNYYSR